MLTASSVLEDIHKDNPSNEEKKIWSTVNAPVINQVRQEMASVIFTIHTGATQAWGEEAMNKLFGDLLLKIKDTTQGNQARGGVTLKWLW